MTEQIIILLWTAFVIYWLIAARHSKQTKAHRRVIWGGAIGRILLVALILILLALPPFYHRLYAATSLIESIGILLCIVGLAFSVWARRVLGGNWSPNPAETKEGHRLITAGPYDLVRHPIYTGEILALIGSVIAVGRANVVIFLLLFTFGVFMRSRIEDKMMAQEFGAEYARYRERVNSLFPGIY